MVKKEQKKKMANNNKNSNKKEVASGRKAWYYVPLPNEMVDVLDRIVRRHGRKYGQMDKAQLVRALLGYFIEQYEISGENYIEAILRFRGGEYKDPKKNTSNNNSNNSFVDVNANNNTKARLFSYSFPYVL